MTRSISILAQVDEDIERRRALAKIYRLLLKLAEEAENLPALPDIVGENERNKAAGDEFNPEYSISETANCQ